MTIHTNTIGGVSTVTSTISINMVNVGTKGWQRDEGRKA